MSFEVGFMRRSIISFTGYVTLAVALAAACSPEPLEVAGDDDDDDGRPRGGNASGGTTSGGQGGTVGNTGGTGGTLPNNTGGTVATGGTGGSVATGGTGTAGNVGKGGTGGVTATGGSAGTATGKAGSTGVGGAAGTPGAGGTAPTAGTTGAAGTNGLPPVECGTAFSVGSDGFVRAPAVGGACWHGYASAGGDAASTVMPEEFGMCGPSCMLNVTGTVGPAVAPSYAGVAYLGFNLNQGLGASTKATVTPTGTGIAVAYGNAGASAIVRVQISSGTGAATRWCAPLATSGAVIPYTTFNTECWEGGAGTAYAKGPIDTLQLIVPGGEEAAPLDIQLTSIKEM